ncbi:hypothetical protein KVR01_008314 [Diaporthe batatas]|uniref:uncharacterized protein n=1 Tax=Diaporthe batatas TaxID=748121 RepID=UPI001D03657D|nr:uncharacterized protein KVR01_008314 [Diaporthe batatas]KAG8162549.1 hypothetical protein KVR01_008314 [Diaporthe batatas]
MVSELKEAHDGMIHQEGDLSFSQQRRSFEYIFWPPLPKWCLVPFEITAATLRTAKGQWNPIRYGLGQNSADHMWKNGVLAVFQPWRRLGQAQFDHLLIPVYFPWQDESTPDEVPMYGLVHLSKGSRTAYLHVMSEWQQQVFDAPEQNKMWAEGLVEQLTSEKGVDRGLFLGGDASIKIKYVPNRVGPGWKNLGWRGRDMAELSKLSFYYIVYAATQLAVHGRNDVMIPQFGLQEVFAGLAQALLGVSTALDNADEGRKSVRDGIKPRVGRNASDTLAAHRKWLDRVLPSVVSQYNAALSRAARLNVDRRGGKKAARHGGGRMSVT